MTINFCHDLGHACLDHSRLWCGAALTPTSILRRRQFTMEEKEEQLGGLMSDPTANC